MVALCCLQRSGARLLGCGCLPLSPATSSAISPVALARRSQNPKACMSAACGSPAAFRAAAAADARASSKCRRCVIWGTAWPRAAIKKPPHWAVCCWWARSIRRRRRCIHPGESLGPASASLLLGSEALASARFLGVQADTGWRRKEKSWRISFGSLGTIAGVLCLSNVLCMSMVDFLCESFMTCTKRYVLSDGLGLGLG